MTKQRTVYNIIYNPSSVSAASAAVTLIRILIVYIILLANKVTYKWPYLYIET